MKAFYTFFLLLLPIILLGQGSITGIIRSDQGAVPGAAVQVKGTDLGASTDENGRFTLEGIGEGEHLLLVRALGFIPVDRKVEVSKGKELNLEITLEENSIGLEEVVVTGNMEPTFVRQSPTKVEVMTANHVADFVPSASASLVDAAGLMNGVQQVVACGVCYTNALTINGLPGQYTAILVDNTPMYGNLASVYGLNGIPNAFIERYEVIKGPSSTLFGSEAVGGVINIITKDPKALPRAGIDVMAASNRELYTNLTTKVDVGKSVGFIGYNMGLYNGWADRNADGFNDLINMDRHSLFSKWDIHRKEDRLWTLAGKLYFEDRRNGVESFLANRNYRDIRGNDSVYGESIYTQRAELFGTYQLPTSEKFMLDYSFSSHVQDSYYGSDLYLATQHLGYANLRWHKNTGRHQVLSGLTFRAQWYDDSSPATGELLADSTLENRPDKQFIPGVFVQDEWQATEKLTLLGGLRLDHYDLHGPILSPRFSVKLKPATYTTLRANFGTGFRVVNLFTEDHAFVTGQRSVEIATELRPEQSLAGALNLNHLFMIGRVQGTVDADAFYTYFTNKIIPNYDSPGKIIYKNTDGHAVTQGLALNLGFTLPFPLTLSGGATWMHVTETEQSNQGASTHPVEFAPEWTGVAQVGYRFEKIGLAVSYSMNLTGPMALPETYDLDAQGNPLPQPRSTRSETFSIHNLQVTKRMGKALNLYGGIRNLLDYYQPVSPLSGLNDPNKPSGFSPYFDTAYAFSPLEGREFYLGLNLALGTGK